MKNRGISDPLNLFCNLIYNNLDKSKPVIATLNWLSVKQETESENKKS